jgi:triacylglycerol lipase
MKIVALISSLLAALDGHTPPVVAPGRNPVVLVHGIHSDSGDFARMAKYLRAGGWEVFTPDLTPNGGQAGIDELAKQLEAFTEKHFRGRKLDLVGFSMGGLVSRYYLQRLGGLQRVDRFVSLAAPHHGTILAHCHHGNGCRQMRPKSALLQDLERDADALQGVKFTSIYTPLDLIIVPARSSAIPQAKNIRIWASMHPSLILEKRCLRAVERALKE